jgi:hypothetical protein
VKGRDLLLTTTYDMDRERPFLLVVVVGDTLLPMGAIKSNPQCSQLQLPVQLYARDTSVPVTHTQVGEIDAYDIHLYYTIGLRTKTT